MALLTRSSLLLSLAFLVALSAAAATPGSESAIRMKIDPTEISVDMFYSGATVHVEGSIPVGYDAAVVCRGREGAVELKRKGKVLKFLWMNVGEVVFEDVPSLYVLSTSSTLADLAPPRVLEELGVGYGALRSRALGSPEQAELNGYFAEFLKLKEREGLYSYEDGGVKLEPGTSGAMRISAEFMLPTKAPWGEYEVDLLGFKGGRGELLRTERLRVAPVGLTARVSVLAQRHGLVYGILAVLVALVVGLVTGLGFGLASKKGH